MCTKWKILTILLSLLLQVGNSHGETDDLGDYRLSDPVAYGNLAIYFVRGKSRTGPVPLALQEAMAKQVIAVRETGRVNELQVENTGDEEIFIQAGDIVKGGRQDRVLSISLMLPPHSGAVLIEAFCVEGGRWSPRGGEDAWTFSSAGAMLPSRRTKLEMAGAMTQRTSGTIALTSLRQQQIWEGVAQIQRKLSSNLASPVASPRSRTSLQLTLENDHLAAERAEYIAALQPEGEQSDDIVGYVFAVNGTVNSGDIYPSNGLFRKMWPKLLSASVTEAIGERNIGRAPAPPTGTVKGIIADTERAIGLETGTREQTLLRVRETADVVLLESRPSAAPADAWIHRSYIAK
jgi:hypothetical protein